MLKRIYNFPRIFPRILLSASQRKFCCYLSAQKRELYFRYLDELKRSRFIDELVTQTDKLTKGQIGLPSRWEIFYILIRMLKPEIVIETGVLHGESTAFILKAMHDEGRGKCYSIDLPAVGYNCDEVVLNKGLHTLPDGLDPGWAIPEYLRSRWEIIHGKSSEKLEPLLNRLGKIDIFFHDSLHTYENMLWEYNTVWPCLKESGILLSHDIFCNKAFKAFCQEKKRRSVYRDVFGGIRK